MSVPPQNLEFRIGDFLLHCLVVEKIVLDCCPSTLEWTSINQQNRTLIRSCWYRLIRELNRLIFAPTVLIHCFISSLTMLRLFLRILYLLSSLSSCFFLLFLFSIKLFTKSKFRLSSFSFSSNRLFHQVSFFVFGSSLAPTNSVTYAAAAYIVLFSSVRFRVSIFLSTQFT